MTVTADKSRNGIRTLLAEDDPVFQHMLRALLTRWGYDVEVAADGTSAWRILAAAGSPPLAILDWMMPGMDGVEICRGVRALGREPYTYIVLLSARTDAADLVAAMDAGADDYITKPFDAHELRVRLRAGSRIVELQRDLLRTREALREQATHDSLTGLTNRGRVLEILGEELSRSRRDAQPLAVLLIDLDHFKRVNDTYGHAAGDAVLVEAGHRMAASLSCHDSVGRYGGEEFLIVAPCCDARAGHELAHRVRNSIAEALFEVAGQKLALTCSIGMCSVATETNVEVDTLVRDADLALYTAKHNGRNRVEVIDTSTPQFWNLATAIAATNELEAQLQMELSQSSYSRR